MSTAQQFHEYGNVPVERFQLGEITNVTVIDPAEYGMNADIAPKALYGVEVADPYVDRYSAAEIAQVRFEEQAANDFAAERREAGKWERRPGTAYFDSNDERHESKHGFGDPVSRDKFFNHDLASPAINAWRTKIPSAEALADLSDPMNITEVSDNQGNVVPMDEDARKWLSLCTDAVGIRSRATVMAEIISGIATEHQQKGEDTQNMRWLSVACGTALPSMQGAMKAGIAPELMLADFDTSAMNATEKLAQDIGYTGTITRPASEAIGQDGINIFDTEKMAQLKEYLEANGGLPKIIDLMGIFEYTGDNLGVDSAKFLSSCYDMLAPGGKLVFGQMRSDRRVADFTMGVVSWPYVEMRSPAEFMQVIADADIDTKNVTGYAIGDLTYFVGVIEKPEQTTPISLA